MTDQGISVVIATYNRARFIGSALDSLLWQTRLPDEIIVVDDCSSDDTRARVNEHAARPRIQYYLQAQNSGASVARNVGVEMAGGDIIVFLDSDDILEPIHHESVMAILRNAPQVGLVCSDATLIDEHGTLLHAETFTSIQASIKNVRIASGVRSLPEVFAFSTSFPGLTIRRDLYLELGGLDQSLFPLDDYDLQLKAAASSQRVHYEHRPLARYRSHGANESGSNRAVRTCERKLHCISLALERYPTLRSNGEHAKRRVAEARRELAFALFLDGQYGPGIASLLRSLGEAPGAGVADVARIVRRRIRGTGKRAG